MNEHIANSSSSSSGGSSSPFGVKLKSTPCAAFAEKEQQQQQQQHDVIIHVHKRLQEDEAAEQKLSHQRCNLRKVPGPSPSLVRRQRRMERKPSVKTYSRPGENEPFTLLHDNNKVPVFGVVLRSVNKRPGAAQGEKEEEVEEKEEYLDLDFGGNSRSSPSTAAADAASDDAVNSNDNGEETGSLYPFGVRLKPTRQLNNNNNNQHQRHPGFFCRAYQIDLSPPPPSKCNNNTYRNEHPRSLLEIKLRPIEKSATASTCSGSDEKNDNDQQLVELQLRHVVAPEDGGPKRVTQALIVVPLKKVPSLLNRSGSSGGSSHLQDLLQLSIHASRQHNNSHVPEFLQIRLRHVNPETQQTHDARQVIDLKLNHCIPTKANSGTLPLSMQVTLRHVERINRTIPAWVPEFASIQLKSVAHCQEKHVDDDDDDEDHTDHHHDDGEEGTEYEEDGDDDIQQEEAVVEKDKAIEGEEEQQAAAANIEAAQEADKQEAEEHKAKGVKFQLPEAAAAADVTNSPRKAKEERERQRRQAEEDAQKAREERERLAELKKRRDEAASRRLQHEIDTLKREAEEWERNKKLKEEARLEQERQAKEQAELELQKKKHERREKIKLRRQLSAVEKKAILERREGAYLYWQKLARPTKDHFKRTIHLLGNTGITNQDIDILPWMPGDNYVDIRLMNEAAVKGEAFWGTIEEKLFESENSSSSS